MTLAELYDQLDRHDWYYQMSDAHSVWLRGGTAEAKLHGQAHSIEGGQQLLADFAAHHFSGPPWGTEKKPKPVRPIEGAA